MAAAPGEARAWMLTGAGGRTRTATATHAKRPTAGSDRHPREENDPGLLADQRAGVSLLWAHLAWKEPNECGSREPGAAL